MKNFDNIEINNTLTVSHLQFFPCLMQLALFENRRRICLDIYENFPKQTFRNRTVVMSSQGLLNIIVPVQKNGQDKVLMRDIEISYSQKWNVEAWRTIFSCYGKSPFFMYYSDKIKDILYTKYEYLMDLNFAVYNFLKQVMNLQCELFVSSEYIDRNEDNYRDAFLPKNREIDGKYLTPYYQCFEEKFGFQTNLSALDLLFNLGNESGDYIKKMSSIINL